MPLPLPVFKGIVAILLKQPQILFEISGLNRNFFSLVFSKSDQIHIKPLNIFDRIGCNFRCYTFLGHQLSKVTSKGREEKIGLTDGENAAAVKKSKR
jgi:hypothetical protein